mmetsp:Transcript_655/g.1987  ORF Transcript_655/g.1987 Transcript_655/m.1987 type:complete len:283 (+) Transcript_655:519-1367(+)
MLPAMEPLPPPRPAAPARERTLRALITQKPPCSVTSLDCKKSIPRWMYFTLPVRPLRGPSTMVTWSLMATWLRCVSVVGRIARDGMERLMSESRQTRMSGLSGVPWFVSTRHESFSMCTMTPTVWWSSTTRSCRSYSPSLSWPLAISFDSARSRAKARNSFCVMSLNTTQMPSSDFTTMPVLPLCLPLMHFTWSPETKNLASCPGSKVRASLRSCMSGITTILPSSAFWTTRPVSSLRSPSTTMTLSPLSNVVSGRLSSLSLTPCMSVLSSPCSPRSSSLEV